MSATTAGAVKAWLEGQALGVAVYRDSAPINTPLPYVTVTEAVALTPDRDGAFDRDVTHTVVEVAQVDVWQRWRSDSGQPAEQYDLPHRVRRALDAAVLPSAPGRVYGCRSTGMVRLLEVDENVVHHAVTINVYREA